MTGAELKAWQAEHGYTVERLAAALEVHEMTVYRWRRDEYPIPHVVTLALRSL